MKIKVPFETEKYTCNVPGIIVYNHTGQEYDCEILKTDAGKDKPIIVYIPYTDDIIKLNVQNDLYKLFVLVEVQNFWINIYLNINTGSITNGVGRYGTEEEAKNHINPPTNSRYHSTIYCS